MIAGRGVWVVESRLRARSMRRMSILRARETRWKTCLSVHSIGERQLGRQPDQAVRAPPLWSRLLARTVLVRNEAAPPGAWESCPSGCILVVLLRTLVDGSPEVRGVPAWSGVSV